MAKAVFKIQLDRTYNEPVTVHYKTTDGTAKDGINYVGTSGIAVIPSGQLHKDIEISVIGNPGASDLICYMDASSATNATIIRPRGILVIPANSAASFWKSKFDFTYNLLTDINNGYFGPKTGPNAYMTPYHAKERAIIVEAPDWTHESVSETASFWVKLEAWNSILGNGVSGLAKAWDSIERVWIPSGPNQPTGDYDPEGAADYIPDAFRLQDTPVNSSIAQVQPRDPIAAGLERAYGTKDVYLMHWLIDVDGDYGFHNADGSKVNVYINNYQRGPVEDGMATITHGCVDDWANGGGPFGFQPIYNRSLPVYPDAASPHAYSKSASYSMAGDADVRVVGNSYLALRHSTLPANLKAKASKMADYIRYTLFDKYFQPIPGYSGEGCHYLLSWGCGFGVGLPTTPSEPSYWGFRIGNSEVHHGYNGVDVAYAARTGQELEPLATGSGAVWNISLDRQLEMIRWLQSPEGPIAGGVTSSWRGRYETPDDGRQNATFYGMYYNYSPSWFNPPSNNWTGFQAWGLQRVSEVFIHATERRTNTDEASIAHRCEVILDKFMPWFVNNCEISLADNTLSYPVVNKWGADAPIVGKTATKPSGKFVGLPENPPVVTPDLYEYLPSLTWPGTNPNYGNFWSNDNGVPNPNLHCETIERGWDPGTASGFAQILLQYCYAKSLTKSMTSTIPGTTITYQKVLQLAADIMEFLWLNKTPDGYSNPEKIGDKRMDDILWIPPEFGSHRMPNGEVLANGQTTFLSMRHSFYSQDPAYPKLRAWLDNGADPDNKPVVSYHRFWNGADVAVGFAMLEKYFPNIRPSSN